MSKPTKQTAEAEKTYLSAAVSPAAEPVSLPAAPDDLVVGTLRYNRFGLLMLTTLLLGTAFFYFLMQGAVPNILPLKLKSMHVSDPTIALLTGTMGALVNFLACPVISFYSDRVRSRWGRRLPIIMLATPLITMVLVLFGFSPELAAMLQPILGALAESSPNATLLGVLTALLALFCLCNVCLGSIYYYLFNDIIPKVYLGRFMAMFRVVSTSASALYSLWLYPMSLTHTRWIFVGCGAVFLAAFTLLCLRVREGKYPPPPPNKDGGEGVIAASKTFFMESYKHSFYLKFFAVSSTAAIAGAAGPFGVFFNLSLGLTLEQMGLVGSVMSILCMLLLYPAGILVDKYHPLPLLMIRSIVGLPLAPLGAIYLIWDFSPHTCYMLIGRSRCWPCHLRWCRWRASCPCS